MMGMRTVAFENIYNADWSLFNEDVKQSASKPYFFFSYRNSCCVRKGCHCEIMPGSPKVVPSHPPNCTILLLAGAAIHRAC